VIRLDILPPEGDSVVAAGRTDLQLLVGAQSISREAGMLGRDSALLCLNVATG